MAKKRLPKEFEITIEKFSRTGEGVGRFKNRSIFVWGCLLGEKLLVTPTKLSRGKAKAKILKVLEASPLRRKAKEDHFLTCSPWQIMPEEEQLKLKKKLVKDIFVSEAGKLPHKNIGISASKLNWSYRNKMEYSFAMNDEGKLSLAFHERGRYWSYYKFEKCELATKTLSTIAKEILKKIHSLNIELDDLKNLVMRYSYSENKCLAVLYVTQEDFKVFNFKHPNLSGFQIIYSDPQSPATVETKKLLTQGDNYITEKILETKLKYYYDSFFQISPKDFESLATHLKEKVTEGKTLLDLYCGVGTIGLVLASKFEKLIGLEYNAKAIEAARENAKANNVNNTEFYDGMAEKQDLETYLKQADTVIVDPPRSGLHPKVVKKILKVAPKHFIYVSCNPHTQAMDLKKLKEKYKVTNWQLFDMYPQTPHVESVLLMRKKRLWFF